jgi:phage tail sheath protein FI
VGKLIEPKDLGDRAPEHLELPHSGLARRALMGTTPEEAFFVKCDRTTMTPDDLDNGRLICLIGVAPVQPAEFLIFRLSQKTLEAEAAQR